MAQKDPCPNPIKTKIPHVVNHITLPKCCKIGSHWYWNEIQNEYSCVEGVRNITIDLVFRVDKEHYETLESKNISEEFHKLIKR
jgi:hypothetical protein